MSSTTITHPDCPRTLEAILDRGSKWFVDAKNDQYALLYLCTRGKIRSHVYTHRELLKIDTRMPDTLMVLALCGAISQEIQTGLRNSYAYWEQTPHQLVTSDPKLAPRYFKDLLRVYTQDENLVAEAKCYQVVQHPDVAWPVVKPWLSKVSATIDPVGMEEKYPGFISSLETAAVLGLSDKETANYCMEQLHLESPVLDETVSAPYDIT